MLGACSSTSSPATTTSAPAKATRASTIATITSNWKAFFSGTTPAARKVALLEDGSRFKQVIDSQASSGLAKSAGASVTSVTAITSTSARVRYNIDLNGAAALSNQVGEAVVQDGTWKVSDASFCVLLHLEGTKVPSCPAS